MRWRSRRRGRRSLAPALRGRARNRARAPPRRRARRRSAARGRAAEFRQSGIERAAALRQSAGLRRGQHRLRLDQSAAARPNLRRDARRPATPGRRRSRDAALAHRAGHEPDRDAAALDRVRHIGALGDTGDDRPRPPSRAAASRRDAGAAAAPRNPLVRIPDGTATGGIAGTVNTTQLTTASATLLRRRTAVEEDAFAPLGVRAGAFLVLPAIEVTGGYDTNPARTPSGRASSFVTVSPELLARSDWQRHEVTAALRGSYTAYDKTPELDRPSFDGKVTGRLDVTRDTALIGEGTLIVGTDNPGSPNVQAGLTRFPIYTTLGGTFGLHAALQPRRGHRQGHGRAHRIPAVAIHRRHDRQQRRPQLQSLRRHAAHQLRPDAGAQALRRSSAPTRASTISQFDRFGLQRNSNGWIAKGGSTFEFSRKLTGEVAVGWIERNYEDPTLQELNGFLFDASLIYSMSALTNVKLTRHDGRERDHGAGHRRRAHAQCRRRGRARVPPLADRRGEVQLRPRRLCRLDAQGRPLFGLRRAHLQAQPHGAGQRRGPPGMAALDRAGRRLRRHRCSCSACGCSADAVERATPKSARFKLSVCGTPARCRRARAHRRRWRRGSRASSRSRRCGPRTGSRSPAASSSSAQHRVGQLDLAARAGLLRLPAGRRSPAAGCSAR